MRLSLVAPFAFFAFSGLGCEQDDSERSQRSRVAAVEVAAIERGPIALRRTFSGTLEAEARIVVAANIAGRIDSLPVDIGDPVKRGQLIAELEHAELEQNVAAAQAALEVARAASEAAEAEQYVAKRNLDRFAELKERQIASDSQLDGAKGEELTSSANLARARAEVTRSRAAVAAAKIRLNYSRIEASWSDGDDTRVVAERFVDAGDLVGANDPILSIVETDPVRGVFFVTERDYGSFKRALPVSIETDAYAGMRFNGVVERIAPVFRAGSRQARVEVIVENPDERLRPGMFIRADVELRSVPEAVHVPEAALARRKGQDGVFLVSDDGKSVAWKPVQVGVREGERIELIGSQLSGRVVTLGQHLVDDGAAIAIPEERTEAAAR